MYVVKIIKCSYDGYWYNDKIGQYFDIIDQKVNIDGYYYTIREIKQNRLYLNINSMSVGDAHKIKINKIKYVDIVDVEIYSQRELKIKHLLNGTY